MRRPRFATLIAVVALAGAGCGGAVTSVPTTAPTQVATAAPTAAPTVAPAPATPAPTRTAAPTPTTAPTIGQPADDGARIIAVDAHPPNLVCTYAGCSSPGTFTGARARDLTIDSPAVGTVKVRLLLPRHFDTQPSTRWPVLYLLPGANGPYQTWTDVFDVEELTAPTDLLVVMPDAGDGGWYSDWWNRGEGGPPMWETFHLVELRQLLERNWQAGDKRAIAGISMGGYGAIEYAERQPGMFRFAASYSGPLDTLGGPDFRSVTGASDSLWGDPVKQVDVWKAHDPTTNAAALKDTALYVACGNGQLGPLDSGSYDPTGSLERDIAAMSASFVKRLGELKIPVTVYAYTGTHFDPYWERAFEQSLPLLLKALGE